MRNAILILVLAFLAACATPHVPTNPALVVVVPKSSALPAPVSAKPALKPGAKPEGCAEVEVNYDLGWIEMARGYDYVAVPIRNGDIKHKPRAVGSITRQLCWFKFAQDPLIGFAKRKIQASGEFLVADLWELNAIGKKLPKLQVKFTFLFALGSLMHYQDHSSDYVLVPSLNRHFDYDLSVREYDAWHGIGVYLNRNPKKNPVFYPRLGFLAVRK